MMHMLIVVAAFAVAAITPFLGAPPTDTLSAFVDEAPAGDEAEPGEAD